MTRRRVFTSAMFALLASGAMVAARQPAPPRPTAQSQTPEILPEAKEMELEAESRLQMIEAASRRGTELAGNELALKKLTARSEQLPLALEEAKMEDEIRRELTEQLENELAQDLDVEEQP